jgi:hypothetical protein
MTLPLSKENFYVHNVALNIGNTVVVAIVPPAKTAALAMEAGYLVYDFISGKSLYQDTFKSLTDVAPEDYCVFELGSRYAMVAESLVFTRLSSFYLSSHYEKNNWPSLPLLAVGNAALENGIAAAKYKICLYEAQSYVGYSDSPMAVEVGKNYPAEEVEVIGKDSCSDNGDNLCQGFDA